MLLINRLIERYMKWAHPLGWLIGLIIIPAFVFATAAFGLSLLYTQLCG